MGGGESRPLAQLGFSPWRPGDPVPVQAPRLVPKLQAPEVFVRSLGPTARLVGSKGGHLLYYVVEETGTLMEIDCEAKMMRKAVQPV